MKIKDGLNSGIDRADAEILLSFGLLVPRTWVISHPEHALSDDEIAIMTPLIERRKKGEPLAYLIKQKEFYGRPFVVDPAVLIPRPATEQLVDIALNALQGQGMPPVVEADNDIVIASYLTDYMQDVNCVVDIGTGSGCIAITIAAEKPTMRVIATDISDDALHIATLNAEYLDVENIEFINADAVDALKDIDEPFLIVSNPPYIPEGTQLMKDVMDYEPHSALFAGKDGTDVLKKIAKAKDNPRCAGIIVECRKEQTYILS